VLLQPSLRTLIASFGANEILGDFSAEVTRGYLTDPLMEARKNRRTDGSLVHVIVTTVPSLGLYTDFGADEIIDFASAVSDPANPGKVKPAYLTDGVPKRPIPRGNRDGDRRRSEQFPPEAQL